MTEKQTKNSNPPLMDVQAIYHPRIDIVSREISNQSFYRTAFDTLIGPGFISTGTCSRSETGELSAG